MLGDFIIRCLVLLFGYAYPAFECFKSIEKNRVDVEEIRFWCQYWIIVAMLTVCERVGDLFVSWVPMYGEMKLAFIIYLWYPKTKGSGQIYEALLRPFVAKHETDIDRKFQGLKARAWDFAIYYWQNCTNLGQSTFFQVLEYFAAQTGKSGASNNDIQKPNPNPYEPSAPPVPPPNHMPSIGPRPTSRHSKWPPRPPPAPGGSSSSIRRLETDSPKSHRVQVRLDEQTETLQSVDPETYVMDKFQQPRMRLRRSKPIQN